MTEFDPLIPSTKIRNEWYGRKFVMYEILKSLKFRTTDLLQKSLTGFPPKFLVRYCFANDLVNLQKTFDVFGFLKYDNVNLYCSNALLKFIPFFTPNLKRRKNSEDYIKFKDDYVKNCVGYDFFIDLDFESDKEIMQNLDVVKLVKGFFEGYKIPFSLRFSGKAGFHFVIPDEFLPKVSVKEKVVMNHNILEFVKNFIEADTNRNLDCIDLSIYQPQRVIKVPYSYDRGNICLPLTDQQFNSFSMDLVNAENVLSKVRVFKRGILLKDYGLSTENLIKNVAYFIAENFVKR